MHVSYIIKRTLFCGKILSNNIGHNFTSNLKNHGIRCLQTALDISEVRDYEQPNPLQSVAFALQQLNLDQFCTNLPKNEEQIHPNVETNCILKSKQEKYRKIEEAFRNTDLKISENDKTTISNFIPGELEQRYYNLLNLGFKNITVDDLLRFKQILNMKRFCLEIPWDPLESIISETDAPKNYLKEKLLTNYPILLDADLKLIHRIVLLEYLRWKLELETKSFLSLINKYPSVCNKSISILRDLIELLTYEFGFTKKKIVTSSYLLLGNKTNIDRMLSEKQFMGGIPIRDFIRIYPKTLLLHLDRINETDVYLNEFGITTEQILACGHIYSFKPSTVHQRLKSLMEIIEIDNFKCHRRYLNLVYFYTKVKHRLEVVKFFKHKNITIDLLVTSNKLFIEKLDLEGCRRRKHEIVSYLAKQLQITPHAVYLNINFEYFLGLNFDERKLGKSIEFLRCRFSREEIVNNLSVILFDLDTVKEELEAVKKASRTKVNMLSELRVNLDNSLKKLYLKPYKPDYKMKYGRKVDNDSEEKLMNKFFKANDSDLLI